MPLVLNKPVIQQLVDPLFDEKQLNVFVLRLDRIHDFISGNKWYKLKCNIEEFQKTGKEYLVTFGGAYSNHLTATAQAGKEFNFKTIGIVRGEELNEQSNEHLKFASACGMKIIFVSRDQYRRFREHNELLLSQLPGPHSGLYFLPEGGSNELAVKGCEGIIQDISIDFDFICVACGTGTTLSGITRALKTHQQAIGISVLSGGTFMKDAIKKFTGLKTNFEVLCEYHFGGYAKSTQELDSFCTAFSLEKNIPIEPVYTGKLFFGIFDLIKKGYFEKGKTIVIVHTGGINDFAGANPNLLQSLLTVVFGKIRTEKLNFLNFTNYEKIKTNIYHIL